jgi:hypothetical protein
MRIVFPPRPGTRSLRCSRNLAEVCLAPSSFALRSAALHALPRQLTSRSLYMN